MFFCQFFFHVKISLVSFTFTYNFLNHKNWVRWPKVLSVIIRMASAEVVKCSWLVKSSFDAVISCFFFILERSFTVTHSYVYNFIYCAEHSDNKSVALRNYRNTEHSSSKVDTSDPCSNRKYRYSNNNNNRGEVKAYRGVNYSSTNP
jgi:hypothetical protein